MRLGLRSVETNGIDACMAWRARRGVCGQLLQEVYFSMDNHCSRALQFDWYSGSCYMVYAIPSNTTARPDAGCPLIKTSEQDLSFPFAKTDNTHTDSERSA